MTVICTFDEGVSLPIPGGGSEIESSFAASSQPRESRAESIKQRKAVFGGFPTNSSWRIRGPKERDRRACRMWAVGLRKDPSRLEWQHQCLTVLEEAVQSFVSTCKEKEKADIRHDLCSRIAQF